MRPFIILAGIIVVAGLAWFVTEGDLENATVETSIEDAGETVEPATEEDAAVDESAGAAVEDAVSDVEETVEGAVDEVSDTVDDAIKGAEEAVEGVLDEIDDAASGALDITDGAADPAGNAVNAVTDTVEDATGEGSDATEVESGDVTEPAIGDGADDTTSEEKNETEIASALTAAGFDAERLRAFITDSDLNAVQKAAAAALVTQAENNPDQLQSLLDQLQSALGL